MVEIETKTIHSDDLSETATNQDFNETDLSEETQTNYDISALPPEPLYGRDLLQAVENIRADKSEKAIRTGHFTITNGKVRAKNTQFLEALCEAKSIPYRDRTNSGKRGRNATYYTKVQQPGSVTVGRRYIEEWGLAPGDPVRIEVKRKQLILRKLEESEMDDFNRQQHDEEDQESNSNGMKNGNNHNFEENNGDSLKFNEEEEDSEPMSSSENTTDVGFDDQLDW